MSNTEKALQAFNNGHFKEAANIWINGHCLPDDTAALRIIYNNCQDKADADVYALLGFIFLDYSHVFTNDRETALLQVVSWSKQGLALDPRHHLCARHAGSALYWLGDHEGAKKYYELAVDIAPSATLQIRLFNISGSTDYTQLQFDMNGIAAMDYYNAGVEVNRITRGMQDPTHPDYQYLSALKFRLYQKAYNLYEECLVKKSGNPLNNDGHTFAMCCNNLSIELMAQEDYAGALQCLNTGMQFSYFRELLENRLYAYEVSGQTLPAFEDAMKMFEDFEDDISSTLYFHLVQVICKYYKQTDNITELADWASTALEEFMDLEPAEQSDNEILRYYSNIMMYKAEAEMKAGIYDGTQYVEAQDQTLLNNPSDPTLIINRAMLFDNEGNHEKALECYDQAIHKATIQNLPQSLRVAYYNKGYLLLTKLGDPANALTHFAEIESIGLADFWSYYWCAHCCYDLQENEACLIFADRALALLEQTPDVHAEIIAILYGYKGTSFFDLEDFDAALANYRKSLEYADNAMVRGNIEKLLAM